MTPGDVVKYLHEKWTVFKVDADVITLVQYRHTVPSIRTAHINRSYIPGLKLSGELKTKEDGK